MSDHDRDEALQRVEALTFKLLDEQISDAEQAELERLLADDEAAAARHRELVLQEATLRGERRGFDLTEPAMARLRATLAQRVEQGAMQQIRADAAKVIERIEGSWRWLGSRRFWQVAAAAAALLLVVAGGQTVYMQSRRPSAQEAFIYGQPQLVPGAASGYRVFVRDGADARPIAGAAVQVALYRAGAADRPAWRATATTDAHGFVALRPRLAASAPEGDYTLAVTARSDRGASTVSQRLTVKRSYRVLVTTDKPLYQPGQRIRVRALALATADMRPAAGAKLLFEIRDPKGNKVLKQERALSRFGVGAVDFQLADQVNLGKYAISATLGDTASARSVTVKRYRLPRFRVDIRSEHAYYAPGATVRGELTARYTFGPPVANATVELVAKHFIARPKQVAAISGRTDARGRLRFALPLGGYFVGQPLKRGDAPLSLEAKVVDPAGSKVQKSHDLIVTTRPIRVELLAESGELVPGVKNRVYVVAAYADGRPARAEVTVSDDGGEVARVKTSAAGLGQLQIVPRARGAWKVTLRARDAAGVSVEQSRQLGVDLRPETLLLQTDRAIYQSGQTARLTVLSPAKGGRVFVDVVKDRRTALTQAIDVAKGRGQLALDLPAELFGTLELHAYRVRRDGAIVSDTKVIQVNRAERLQISATLDKQSYRPAERAVLSLAVKHADGTPAQAAVGLAGVDEAVFALHELQPGLARVYFMLQEQLLKPRFELHAAIPFSAGDAVRRSPREVDPRASAALFAAAKGAAPVTRQASETFRQRVDRFQAAADRQLNQLLGALTVAAGLLALAMLLPLLGYGLFRLFRRRTIEGGTPEQRADFAHGVRWLAVWWTLGWLGPPAVFFLGLLIFRGRNAGAVLGLVLGAAALIGVFAVLVVLVRRLRRSPLAAAVPLLRKVITALPAALALGWACLALLVASLQSESLREPAAVALALSLVAAALLVAGALPAAGRSVLLPTTAARWLWVAASRTALAAVAPAVVVVVLLLPTRYKMASVGGDAMPPPAMALRADVDMEKSAARKPDASALGTAALKAPTRVRRHFPETLIWRPEVITDKQGRARVEVPLADSITTWRLSLSAVSGQGELGATTAPLRVFQPFFVDVELPVSLTQNDVVAVPVALYSYLDKPQTVRIALQRQPWFAVAGAATRTVRLAARQVTSVRFKLVAKKPGQHALTVRAHGSALADAVERRVRVAPDGRRVTRTINGQLTARRLTREIVFPRRAIAGGSDLVLKIHPGSFSQVIEGLDNIFAMPHGCFEQTSSTTYPNVLVLDYMRRAKQIKPQIELKALKYINLGYQRLLSFEVAGGGFEWFGKAPAHNVLTAYGLMEFSDMARVFEIDPDVIARTRRWLLSQQRDDGSFAPTAGGIAEGAINRQQGQVLRTTAYIAWALAESLPSGGTRGSGLDRALDYIVAKVGAADDAYTLASAANALVAARRPEAQRVLARLLRAKQVDAKTGAVHWSSKAEGVTHSRGPVLAVETTALAAYALIKAQVSTAVAHRALAWLVSQKDSRGTWRSTQATVLALRALLAGSESGAVKRPTTLVVALGGETINTLRITPKDSDVMRLVSLRGKLRPGRNALTITADRAVSGALAYQIVATHHLPWPAGGRPADIAQKKALSIALRYDSTRLRARDELGCEVTVRYNRPGVAKMVLVDLGLPPGFTVAAEAFARLKQRGAIERYTLTGQQVILYLRQLRAGKPLRFTYKLRAAHPVKVSTPRSRVYKYYQPEVRDETAPVKLTAI